MRTRGASCSPRSLACASLAAAQVRQDRRPRRNRRRRQRRRRTDGGRRAAGPDEVPLGMRVPTRSEFRRLYDLKEFDAAKQVQASSNSSVDPSATMTSSRSRS
jgi:hypothetical protein